MKRMRLLLTTGVGVFSLAAAGLFSAVASADSANINFEGSAYTIGSINGQDGWSATGSAGPSCGNAQPYDEEVSGSNGTTGFGSQSFRISNAVTSSCFGDQAFAPGLAQQAGEPGALDKNGNPVVSPQSHFETQFSIASATKAEQPGLAISVSPDGGLGDRMSYLRFVDQSDGTHVYFDDVTDPTHADGADTFNETDVATLSYAAPHTIKLSMDFVSGPDNDIVKVYVDGNLVHTGTSWEDYYRYDSESNPGLVDASRTVDTVLFRASGTAVPTNQGNGYLFDNLTYTSGQSAPVAPAYPTSEAQCKNSGWKQFTDPAFKNQGQCIAWVNAHANGDLRLSNPHQRIVFSVTNNTAKHHGHNTVSYWNYDYPGGLHYTADVTCSYVNPQTNEARFMFQIPAGHPGLSGQYVVAYVKDVGGKHQPDLYGHAATADLTTATQWCQTGTGFSPTMYTVTKGNVDVVQGGSGWHFRWWF